MQTPKTRVREEKKTRDIVNSVGKIDSNKRSGETKVPRYDYNKRKKKGRDARERRRNIERRKFATEVQWHSVENISSRYMEMHINYRDLPFRESTLGGSRSWPSPEHPPHFRDRCPPTSISWRVSSRIEGVFAPFQPHYCWVCHLWHRSGAWLKPGCRWPPC